MESLGERCLYYDTDSVIFYAKPGDYIPNPGVFLGELTNEVSTQNEPDAYITKFISCGPKNYSYEVYYPESSKNDYAVKIKGLTQNISTALNINFESMKKILDSYLNNTPEAIQVPQTTFETTKYYEKYTKEFFKMFRVVFDKRVVNRDYTTLPYGYIKF